MPILRNSRHELFAQELFKGTSQQKAYVLAGFRPHLSNPSKLAKDKRIIARVAELHSEHGEIDRAATAKAAEALSIDRHWVMTRLKENAERAMQAVPITVDGEATGEYRYEGSVANRALELLGKEIGMFVDRKEIRTGALDGLPADTLAAAREQLIAARDRRPDRSVYEGDSGKPH